MHIKNCLERNKIIGSIDLKQSQLQIRFSGITNWRYSPQGTKLWLTKFKIQNKQTFIFFENKNFETYMQTYLNP